MAKKQSKETTEVVIHNPELTKNLALLELYKADIELQASNCLQIKVVDESTLAICQQNLSKINQLVKVVDEKRAAIKEPYFQASKTIDATAKSLVELAIKAVEHLKSEVKNWETEKKRKDEEAKAELQRLHDEQQAKSAAEDLRKSNIRLAIEQATKTLQICYSKCLTPEDCYREMNYIRDGYRPREFFEEFAEEAYTLKDNYIKLIETKLVQLQSADTMSEEEKKLAEEKESLNKAKLDLAAKEAEIKAKEQAIEDEKKRKEDAEKLRLEQEKITAQAEIDKTRGIRNVWKFELVDPTKLSPEWITVDEVKVKEYLKLNKDTLQDGVVINGIKFYKDMTVTA